jgi:hypothetical protein
MIICPYLRFLKVTLLDNQSIIKNNRIALAAMTLTA